MLRTAVLAALFLLLALTRTSDAFRPHYAGGAPAAGPCGMASNTCALTVLTGL